MFKEAERLFVNGFEDQALSRYIYLAALGFEVANFNAAFILESTRDPIHLKRAAFFYSRSARMENSVARRKLGDAFSRMGDDISAVAHYIVSSKSDSPDPEALFNLGYAYENGFGLKKDLWSALDIYTASLSHGKSGKIAVSLALTKVRVKLFFQNLKNMKSSSLKKRKITLKSRKRSDNTISMLTTLMLTGLIFWYFNYFQPRQQQRNGEREQAVQRVQLIQEEVQMREYDSSLEGSVYGDANHPGNNFSESIHSDSSSSPCPSTEFRFRRQKQKDEKEVEMEQVD